ncbi:MAG TPA: hypothetical protein VFP37_14045, partial [Steroidobacteraceae bacterium]|nr:hypothetical protein [Steroidobacteraceae bacterium]
LSDIGTAIVIAAPTPPPSAGAYGTRAFSTGDLMNAKLLVPLLATAALLAACNNRNNDTGVGSDSDSGSMSTPDDTATTPGGTGGETGTPPATPPDTAAPPPSDTPPPADSPDSGEPTNPPPSGGQ